MRMAIAFEPDIIWRINLPIRLRKNKRKRNEGSDILHFKHYSHSVVATSVILSMESSTQTLKTTNQMKRRSSQHTQALLRFALQG